nr:MAG TPA: hypothetical protein [Caudoviricetes sp.]
MAKQKLTKKERLEREYNKQIRRIERRKKELEQLGYVVSDVEQYKRPKRITEASIRKLKKVTPKFIKEHSRIVSFETGEFANAKTKSAKRIANENAVIASENVMTTTKRIHTPKPHKEPTPNMDETIINNFLALMSELPEPIYHIIRVAVARQISNKGKGFVAQALHDMPDQMQNDLLLAKTPSDSAIIGFETYLYDYLPISEYEKRIIEETQDFESWDDV